MSAPPPAAALPEALVLRAALLGVFDPRELIAPGEDDDGALLAGLSDISQERAFGAEWLWSLDGDARRDALARLPSPGRVRAGLLAGLPLRAGDRLGEGLRAALADRPDPGLDKALRRPGRQDADPTGALLGLFQALQLLDAAAVELAAWAAEPGLRRALQRAVALRRDAAAASALLPGAFRGRTRELALLDAFAQTGARPLRGARGVRPLAPAPGDAAASGAVPALVVAGVGGSGKSALLEALRRRLLRDPGLIVVAFDLDQTALRAGDRVALTLDLLRQVALARPALDAPLSALRGRIRAVSDSAAAEGQRIEAGARAVLGAMAELARALEAEGLGAVPLVILVDTFEEAMVAGAERVRLVADWFATLAAPRPPGLVRAILAGRSAETLGGSAVPGLELVGAVELGDLGTLAGRSRLRDAFRAAEVVALDLVPALIAAFGSNPLVIEILAQHCRGRSRAEIEALLDAGDPAARAGFDAEMRQRFLYARILERIPDPELRRLASPGLVLRRITPRLIAEVLAGPCGLDLPLAPERARALFDALARQVWLVRPARDGQGALEHLPDLRRRMLPQVLALPEAAEVAAAAADWHRARDRDGIADAAWEVLYYRALTDPGALPDDSATLRALADHLGPAVADLPDAARARLREARGQVLRIEEIAMLGGEARDRALSKRRARQVAEGLEDVLLDEAATLGPAAGAEGQDAVRGAAGALPEPDLLRARFAAGDFAGLAALAVPLAEALFEAARSGADGEAERAPLDHPAYLAALATLAPGAEAAALRAELAEAIAASAARPGAAAQLAEAVLRAPEAAAAAEGALAAALITAGAAGLRRADLFGTLRGPGAALDDARLLAATAATVAQWRLMLALAPEPREDAPQAVFSLRLTVLPWLNPGIVDSLGGPSADWIAPLVGEAGLAPLARLAATERPVRLGDLADVEIALAEVALRIVPARMPPGLAHRLLAGRLPEFHAPLRRVLDRERPVPGLERAVRGLSERIAWWPGELAPEVFRGAPGPTAVAALIDTADRCGRLPALAMAIARTPGAPPAARDIAAMLHAFRRLCAGAALGPAAKP